LNLIHSALQCLVWTGEYCDAGNISSFTCLGHAVTVIPCVQWNQALSCIAE